MEKCHDCVAITHKNAKTLEPLFILLLQTRIKTMIGFYYCNVVVVEIKRFQFKLVCVELNRIGLLALINIHSLRAKNQ